MARITKKLNDEKVNLVGLVAKKRDDNKVMITVQTNINNKEELDIIISKLKQQNFALEVFSTA